MKQDLNVKPSSDVLFFTRNSADLGVAQPLVSPSVNRIAVVGNFPPTQCGIASFTFDMVSSIAGVAPDVVLDVYAMVADEKARCPDGVRTLVLEQDRDGYRQAGIELDNSGADMVWLQHEFGLFGGEAGSWIIDMLAQVAAPLAVTFHTLLDTPDEDQRRVMDWLVARACRLVVMSADGKDVLMRVYGAKAENVAIIPHGVPDRPFGRGVEMKAKFGLTGRKVLMTFGLISPGKGIEVAIDAMPDIVRDHPDAVYCIVGATHPKLLAHEGEAYRDALMAQAERLGVGANIQWVNAYLEKDELLDRIEAADIYLTPYGAAGQSTSGTLSYAMALGKAIVSTPYKHAAELLAKDRGVLVPFGDGAAMAEAVNALLADDTAREALQARAYAVGRATTWPVFAQRSLALAEELQMDRDALEVVTTPLPEAGLLRLCDGCGMLQHSVYNVADRAHGYCVDDNARALMLANVSRGVFADRAPVFAAFVQHSWNPDARSFRNFMGYDRQWREDAGSADSNGRTLWAIGATMAHGRDADLRRWARALWADAAPIVMDFDAPRALAFAMLGADLALEADAHDPLALAILRRGLTKLNAAYEHHAVKGHRWFEPYLAYDNVRLPEAMLRAGVRLGDSVATMRAMDALDWITHLQTTADHFRPIGSESFGKPIIPHDPFDQQAVDAWAMVDAAWAAYRHSRDAEWADAARMAYAWFFGRNDRGQSLANIETGACYDGIRPRGLNYNQGAESVLSLHLAQHTVARFAPANT